MNTRECESTHHVAPLHSHVDSYSENKTQTTANGEKKGKWLDTCICKEYKIVQQRPG